MDASTAAAATTITTQANSHHPPPPPPKAELRAPIPISFSNDSATSPHLRKHQPHHVYRECLRNHAASLGGHALDGCGEFMSSPTSPLSCAACGCHRNFHRRLSPSPPPSPSPSPTSSSGDDPLPPSSAPRVLMALRSSGAPPPRKRFRTRFSPEQKERMQELSDRLGWRLQKRDDRLVEDCCRQIGVGKGVFKVWMHNNKHALAPRPHPPSDDAAA